MQVGKIMKLPSTVLAAAVLSRAAPPAEARPSPQLTTYCPVVAWMGARWNDPYGLNVVLSVEAPPGWRFQFAPAPIALPAARTDTIELRLIARSNLGFRSRKISNYHVYGYWTHDALGSKPDVVSIRCGQLPPIRISDEPHELFHPPGPPPPPTVPPPPPPLSHG